METKPVTEWVVETLNYVKKFTHQNILIKLGGSILDDINLVKTLCEDLSLIRAAGIRIVLVHGGSKAIGKVLQAYNIPWKFHEGQRVTTEAMIDLIEMVLCGHINSMLVRTLNAVGVAAIGLSGSDNAMLKCRRFSDTLGEVGEITEVNTELIEKYLMTQRDHQSGIIPVIAPVGVDNKGKALNVNADWAASAITSALDIHKLIYLTDQEGIFDDKGKLVPELDTSQLAEFIDKGIVKAGMLTKAKTILQALNHGIDNIHIISAKRPHSLIEELFTEQGIGTVCRIRASITN